jgi:hypothetical protein
MSVDIKFLEGHIRVLIAQKKGLLDIFCDTLRDKTIPLKIRWRLYTSYGELMLKIDKALIYLPYMLDNNLYYSDLGFDVYKTMITFLEVVERAEENKTKNIDIEQLKEDILDCGYWGFTY